MVNSSCPLTILMSVYNGSDFVKTAMQSVLEQDFANFRFMIVDDCSTDDTLSIVNDFASREQRIQVSSNIKRKGITYNLNMMLEQTSTEFIARMDADDISLPGRFREQICFLQENRHIGVLGTWTRILSTDGEWQFSVHLPSQHSWIYKQLVIGQNVLTHGSVMMRYSVLSQLPKPVYRTPVAQDLDLWLRLADKTQFSILPYEGYAQRIHPNSITSSRTLVRDKQKSYILELHNKSRRVPEVSVEEISREFESIYIKEIQVKGQNNKDIDRNAIESAKTALFKGDMYSLRLMLRTIRLPLGLKVSLWLLSWLPYPILKDLHRRYQHRQDPLSRFRVYP